MTVKGLVGKLGHLLQMRALDGTDLPVRIDGEASAPNSIVIIHGSASHSRHLDPLARNLRAAGSGFALPIFEVTAKVRSDGEILTMSIRSKTI